MSTSDAQQELIDEFEIFDNWMDRYQYLIDMGKALPEFPDALKTSDTRIEGCQSQVWIHEQLEEGRLHFQATSDAAIVSGLIAVLMRIYNDRTPAEIMTTSTEFLQALGLDKHLSPTRSNGLHAMLDHIYQSARVHQ
ncbi:SufE family protein [Larsenimonas salina]|uniref:SufE family protein n=1 Tax=Larsenimonas salina TaxID=1295565 RepID=UPI0020737E2A|nr:SufE family protein [Larsenimonas salina]MCM5703444.1 SufE family protein [Larsenimonas salina]